MMKKTLISMTSIGLSLLLCACHSAKKEKEAAMQTLQQDLMVLSSDSLAGRAPCSAGETKTLNYLCRRLKEIGLEPAFDGSYLQAVPLVKLFSHFDAPIKIQTRSTLELTNGEDICLWSTVMQPSVSLKDVPLVFVGFGADAPEYAWNDFDKIDVAGKAIVVLVNDPGYYLQDASLFKGREMTYYGRWRYKFEEAERRGAKACIIVHEEAAAGYPWAVSNYHSSNPEFYLQSVVEADQHCLVKGWINSSVADKLFAGTGLTYEAAKKKALDRSFEAIDLHATLSLELSNEIETCTSHNVGAVLRGKTYPDACVVYNGHWDHLGIGTAINGDSIYNGASDNAAAVAWVLGIAEQFKSAKEACRRSIMFLIPTAEEPGMLGAEYYVSHANFRPDSMYACINTDVLLFLGRYRDVTVTGLGHSELDEYVKAAAKTQDRYVCADPNPENGMFFRSDQLPFLQAGVPSIFAKGYAEQRDLGKAKTQEEIKRYWKERYHKPQDEYHPERDKLDGLMEDVELFYQIGRQIANSEQKPQFYPSSEFYKKH